MSNTEQSKPIDRPLRLIFFGSGAFGIPTLESLSARHQVLAVVTQPDRPAGRKRRLTPTPIGAWAAEHLPGIDLLKPDDVSTPEMVDRIRSYDCGTESDKSGAWVVIAFGQKLSQNLLADRFAINLHSSLLPRWRGAAPINHAILAGDSETGISVITLAERMDAGLVLGQSRRTLDPSYTAGTLHDLLASDGPSLVGSVLNRFASDLLEPVEQDPSGVTIAPKLSKEDGYLDLSKCVAEEAVRRIHGLNPWPSVTVMFRGEPLKLHRASVLDQTHAGEPGTLLDPAIGTVRCSGGSVLKILEVQPAGRQAMSYEAFANGAKPEAGEPLSAFTEVSKPC